MVKHREYYSQNKAIFLRIFGECSEGIVKVISNKPNEQFFMNLWQGNSQLETVQQESYDFGTIRKSQNAKINT